MISLKSQSGLSRSKLLIIIFIAGLLLATAYITYAKFKMFAGMGKFSFPPPGVVVTKVEPLPFSDGIEAVGTAMANESANLTSRVTEIVKSINFSEGQIAPAGTILVQLSNDEEVAMFTEAQRAFDRADELVKRKAVSVARKDQERMRMDTARAQLNDREIIAPFEGVIGLRHVSVGDLVSPGTVITTIDDIDPVKLEFSVPETFLPAISTGLQIEARTEAYPETLFIGTIIAVDTRIDTQTRSFRIKAAIPNPDLHLKPGLLMSVNIVRNTRNTLAIPEQALTLKGDQVNVLTIGADKKAQIVPVTLGVRRAGFVEVTSGLKEGDLVIVEGLVKTQPGAEVVITATKTIADFITDATAFAVTGKQSSLKVLDAQLNQAKDQRSANQPTQLNQPPEQNMLQPEPLQSEQPLDPSKTNPQGE